MFLALGMPCTITCQTALSMSPSLACACVLSFSDHLPDPNPGPSTASHPLPIRWGLERLGKARKEFALGKGPLRAERAGASESLGSKGEGSSGGLPRGSCKNRPPLAGPNPQTTTTEFRSTPIPLISISTTSSARSVKASGGTTPVPVRRIAPWGKVWLRNRNSARSSNRRLICPGDVSPVKTSRPLRLIRRLIFHSRASASVLPTVIQGPSAHERS